MKNVISFDVGMKNLAYCLFQVDDTDTNNINTSNLLDYKICFYNILYK